MPDVDATQDPSILREFLTFMREEKTWWLAPLLLVLGLVSLLLAAAQGSALSPFLYAFF